MESKTQPNRVTMYGEVYADNGISVMAVLELEAKNQGGELQNFNVLPSAYGKSTNPKGFMEKSDILYLNPDKKRTNTWLQGLGLQLPSDTTLYGSMGSITYNDGKVNIEGTPYTQLMQNGAENAQGQQKYSISYTEDNVPFVIVEEDILDGVPKEKWVETVKDNLKEKFPNGVTVANSDIKINAQSRNEITNSKYSRNLRHNDSDTYADKMRATNNADEILRASREYVNESPMHARTDNIKDFARGTVLLRIGNNDYSAEVLVSTTSGGNMLLYDIVKLMQHEIKNAKKSGTEFTVQSRDTERTVDSSTSGQNPTPVSDNNSIFTDEQNVNTNDIEKNQAQNKAGNSNNESPHRPSAPDEHSITDEFEEVKFKDIPQDYSMRESGKNSEAAKSEIMSQLGKYISGEMSLSELKEVIDAAAGDESGEVSIVFGRDTKNSKKLLTSYNQSDIIILQVSFA